jgi:hypothetical protein
VNNDTAKVLIPALMTKIMPSVNTGCLEVQVCFELLAWAYIAAAVGQEPSRPVDWARPDEVGRCRWYRNCGKCDKINSFLKDPAAQSLDIDLVDHGALTFYHVEGSFNEFRYFVTEKVTGTAGTGGAAALIRTKLTKTVEKWEELHRAWESDVDAAKKSLQALPQERLRELLTDRYDKPMAILKVTTTQDEQPPGTEAAV